MDKNESEYCELLRKNVIAKFNKLNQFKVLDKSYSYISIYGDLD
jgi:hypothetical protein